MKQIVLKFIFIIYAFSSVQAFASPYHKKNLELKIGGIYGLTGPLVELSEQVRNGALLAQEDINSKSSVNISTFFEDSSWEAKRAVSAYKKTN